MAEYTREQLEAMDSRTLAATALEVVGGWPNTVAAVIAQKADDTETMAKVAQDVTDSLKYLGHTYMSRMRHDGVWTWSVTNNAHVPTTCVFESEDCHAALLRAAILAVQAERAQQAGK